VGSCKRGNKFLRSMKCGEVFFFEQLRATIGFFKKKYSPWCWLQGIRWEDVSFVRADIKNFWIR